MKKIYGKIYFDYDKSADVLYATIDDPRPCATMEPESGVVICYDPHINQIVGFTIVDYVKRRNAGKLDSVPYFEDISLPTY